ncbi:MAG: DMT family transporter [Alphaproteobacteria bacterium]|nr:DMT family transporter [Alphaproteobacteria bacterium]
MPHKTKIMPPKPDTTALIAGDTAKAVLFALIGAGMLATMSLFAKLLGGVFGPIEVTFFRNFVGLSFLVVYFLASGQMALVKTTRPWAHLTRAALGTFGIVLGIWAYIVLPLSVATVFFFTMPLYTVALSAPLLGEKVGWRRISAVIVGFGGVVVMAYPEMNLSISPAGLVLGLAYPFVAALVDICLRWMGRTEQPGTTVFYFLFLGSLMTGVYWPFADLSHFAGVTPALIGITLALGLSGVLFQFLKTRSLQLAPVYVTGPLTYTMIFWATSFDYFLWGHVPTWNMALGAIIIISSNLFILWRERQKQQEHLSIEVLEDVP